MAILLTEARSAPCYDHPVIAFEEALANVVGAATPLTAVAVPLGEAAGRVLAEDVAADLPFPAFDMTAMDGWAVRAAEVGKTPSLLARAGAAGAGRVTGPLPAGAAWKVMTGAPMPPGSDAVVPVEEAAEIDEKTVRLDVAPRPGAHVRLHGEVFQKGALLLPAGRRLTPADLVLAAAAGRTTLRVARPIRAAVLVTGDEIVAPGTTPGPAQIRNTNGPLLVSALRRAGAQVTDLGVARDTEESLVRTLRGALERGDDLLLTTGGVSAGDYDYVATALETAGASIRFHKVAIRPAKPVLFATKGATLVFGLPGNPVSAAVGFDFLVRPALRVRGRDPASAASPAAGSPRQPRPEQGAAPRVPPGVALAARRRGDRRAHRDEGESRHSRTRAGERLPRAQARVVVCAGDLVPVHRGSPESTF